MGSALRHLVSSGCQKLMGGHFPLGTLTVNVIGCLAIGFFGSLFLPVGGGREGYRVAIMVGFLGGFTTFSSFALESIDPMSNGRFLIGVVNVVLSVCLGLLAAWVGNRAGAMAWGSP
jgi:CrcB protein